MIIPIDETTRITSDSLQWIIQRRGKKKDSGKWGEWQSRQFFARLDGALRYVADTALRESTVEGLGEALQEVNRVSQALSDALRPHININIETLRR